MLDYKLDSASGILKVAPKDPLSADDFKSLAADVDAWLETHTRLNGILLIADHFPGWDSFAGLIEHMRFVRDHHRQIARIAMVTDNELLKIPPQIAAHFVHPEIRIFGMAEEGSAVEWLGEAKV